MRKSPPNVSPEVIHLPRSHKSENIRYFKGSNTGTVPTSSSSEDSIFRVSFVSDCVCTWIISHHRQRALVSALEREYCQNRIDFSLWFLRWQFLRSLHLGRRQSSLPFSSSLREFCQSIYDYLRLSSDCNDCWSRPNVVLERICNHASSAHWAAVLISSEPIQQSLCQLTVVFDMANRLLAILRTEMWCMFAMNQVLLFKYPKDLSFAAISPSIQWVFRRFDAHF